MKILLTEDNSLLGKSIKQGLEECGWIVDLALDGDEGAYYIESCIYDLIILDWMLPKQSGLELIKKLRALGREDPTIIITARGAVVDRVEGLNKGADDYLVKPFEMVELVARINAIFRRKYSNGNSELEIGNLALDLAAQKVKVNNHPIDLTTKEYDLLATLAIRANHLVQRKNLLTTLYELDSEPESNSLDVLLARVRKKIIGSGVEIETIRGKGFLLRVEKFTT